MTEPVERDCSGRQPAPAVTCPGRAGESPAEAALRLRWLCPGTVALTALGRFSCSSSQTAEDTWQAVRLDPGAVLLLLRPTPAATLPTPASFAHRPNFPGPLLLDPAPVEFAVGQLETHRHSPPSGLDGFVNWSRPEVAPVYRASLDLAGRAHALALEVGVDPERAWVCGLLAALGWMAVAAVAPRAVADCLDDPALKRDPVATQQKHWGLDNASLLRRLARAWALPGWVSEVIGHLGLPQQRVQRLGGDPLLLAITRQAIRLAPGGTFLGLGAQVQALRGEDEAIPGLSAASLTDQEAQPEPFGQADWTAPYEVPLLLDLLRLAAENRKQRDEPRVGRLEVEVDELHLGLEAQVQGEGDRLHSAKLTALAEFAAGAGHEINNPLAVISGQAQYLLGHSDWFPEGGEAGPRKALEAIIAQTRRIHSILRDLMLFARPAPPRPTWLDLPTLLGEVASGLSEMAEQRRVEVEIRSSCDRLAVYLDGDQLRLALTCLLRNAIEAASGPSAGPSGSPAWARLVLPAAHPGQPVEVFIEDSGPGATPAQRPLLFDPFYSGRSAGRGRGLGLPVAWRLARQQGGEVRVLPAQHGEPTRFVLSLPQPAQPGSSPASLSLPQDPRDAAA